MTECTTGVIGHPTVSQARASYLTFYGRVKDLRPPDKKHRGLEHVSTILLRLPIVQELLRRPGS
jgi:hypothetical protein